MSRAGLYATLFLSNAMAFVTLAAEVDVKPMNGAAIVTVTGTLLQEDGPKFAGAVSSLQYGIVVFGSDGGNLFAGLQIGTIIRSRNFATVVPDGSFCASACALAWLGGTRRFMGPRAHIGFHAAYNTVNGERTESGVGNALVGAYLSRIGLSDQAIVYITQAHPTEITWLSLDQAVVNGIDVAALPLDVVEQKRVTDRPVPGTVPQSMEQVANIFLNSYFAHGSESDTVTLGYADKIYAEHVNFYGKAMQHREVIEDKRRFIKRWPERLYIQRPASVQIHCDHDSMTCTISGILDWNCRSPARRAQSTGTATFELQIAVLSPNDVKVVSESGSTVK